MAICRSTPCRLGQSVGVGFTTDERVACDETEDAMRECRAGLSGVTLGFASERFDPFFRPSTYIGMPWLGSARVVFDFPGFSLAVSAPSSLLTAFIPRFLH